MLDCFDQIYIINLPDRIDRRAEIAEQLATIGLSLDSPGVELFEAVRPGHPGGFRSIGARGCFMSHLGVLTDASRRGLERILILEDDADFSRDFARRWPATSAGLRNADWGLFYGGYGSAGPNVVSQRQGLDVVDPSEPIQCTHFVAFRGQAIGECGRYLRAMLDRPAGDPHGGPMDVDGAYSWFRRDLAVRTLIAAPALAHQRASRTDVSPAKWFDRLPVVRSLTACGRRLKNRRARA